MSSDLNLTTYVAEADFKHFEANLRSFSHVAQSTTHKAIPSSFPIQWQQPKTAASPISSSSPAPQRPLLLITTPSSSQQKPTTLSLSLSNTPSPPPLPSPSTSASPHGPPQTAAPSQAPAATQPRHPSHPPHKAYKKCPSPPEATRPSPSISQLLPASSPSPTIQQQSTTAPSSTLSKCPTTSPRTSRSHTSPKSRFRQTLSTRKHSTTHTHRLRRGTSLSIPHR